MTWIDPNRVYEHIIGGERVASEDGGTFVDIDPATEQTIATVSLGTAADVDMAVRNAWSAHAEHGWAQIRPAERAEHLRSLARVVADHCEELAVLDSRESGAPLANRRDDVLGAVDTLNFAASLAEHTRGSVYSDQAGYLTYSTRQPYGVVGAIAPWNFPFYFCVAKTAFALATGNAVVLKMAEQTPLSAVRFAELALDAGIPPGILNVVNGDGDTGRALAEHPGVPKITFTGSTSVGQSIMRASAPTIKSVHLELGGKSANIVFADADLDQALDGTLFTSFFNSGQICTSGSRLLVERPIFDEFVSKLVARVQGLRIGDPTKEETHIGPLVSADQLRRVESMVAAAVAAGADVLTGGGRPKHLSAGFYYSPTLLTGVSADSPIAQEEVFGPVTIILPFDGEAEAIEIANCVQYGLSATVWTNRVDTAMRLADNLEAGILWTNAPHHEAPHIPYEGHKSSGLGEDQGAEAIATFTRLRVNHLAFNGQRIGWGL
jgi:acyl-CoA reductase-like NAD-dependent aldehyde dehydrogenase